MAASINNQFSSRLLEEGFLEKHFVKIAFAISTLVLFILAPLHFLVGMALGATIHFYIEPELHLKANERAVTLQNTLLTIVGAFATLIRLTPAGSGGGFIFRSIPFISSLAVGSTAYRAWRH